MKKHQGQQALLDKLYGKILILPFIFVLAACATGSQIISSGDVRIGMSKAELRSALYMSYPSEDPFLSSGISKMFYKENKEIIYGSAQTIFYVFRNVNTPKKCGDWTCSNGDGYYDSYFYSLKAAEDYLNPKKVITKQKKKKPLLVKTSSETDKVSQLEKLIKELKDGRISEEEFNLKKRKLLNE